MITSHAVTMLLLHQRLIYTHFVSVYPMEKSFAQKPSIAIAVVILLQDIDLTPAAIARRGCRPLSCSRLRLFDAITMVSHHIATCCRARRLDAAENWADQADITLIPTLCWLRSPFSCQLLLEGLSPPSTLQDRRPPAPPRSIAASSSL